MRKVFLLITFMLLLTSCGFDGVHTNILEEDDNTIADKTFCEIISAINLQDASKIRILFSQSIQNELDDLQEKSIDFLEFIQGNIISFSAASESGVGADYKNEKGKKQKEMQSSFCLTTTEGKYYIAIKECTTDEHDSRNVGLISIYIIESENWNQDFIYRGDGQWIRGINIERQKID